MQATIEPGTVFCRDNLDILRGIDSKSIDLIYLDPPFNKGYNFQASLGTEAEGASFKDKWCMDDLKEEWFAQVFDANPKIRHVIDMARATASKSAQAYLIYMAVRLLEMRRALKETGSIWYHCDHSASHHIRCMMDAIFGWSAHVNEIIWKRSSSVKGNASSKFGIATDSIHYYAMPKHSPNLDATRIPLDPGYVEEKYRFNDNNGRGVYSVVALLPFGQRPDENSESFRKLDADGRIYRTRTGNPLKKQYLSENKGQLVSNLWNDEAVAPLAIRDKERTGYPTQKPVRLLERIIRAGTKQGETVLDPFCGCATACLAAEKLQRNWIGIDISKKAYELIKIRLEKEMEGDLLLLEPKLRKDIPERTDITRDEKEPSANKVISPQIDKWKSRPDSDRSFETETWSRAALFKDQKAAQSG